MSDSIITGTQGEAGGEDCVGEDWWAYQAGPLGLSREHRRRKEL